MSDHDGTYEARRAYAQGRRYPALAQAQAQAQVQGGHGYPHSQRESPQHSQYGMYGLFIDFSLPAKAKQTIRLPHCERMRILWGAS